MAKEKLISLNLSGEQSKAESAPPVAKTKKGGLISLDLEGHQQAREDRIAEAEGAEAREKRNKEINPLMGSESFGSPKKESVESVESRVSQESKEVGEGKSEQEGRRLFLVPDGGSATEQTQDNFRTEAQERAQRIFERIRGFRENMRPKLENGRVTPAVFTELLKLGMKAAFRPMAERIFAIYNSGNERVLGSGKKLETKNTQKRGLVRRVIERALESPAHKALREAVVRRDKARLEISELLNDHPELRSVRRREAA